MATAVATSVPEDVEQRPALPTAGQMPRQGLVAGQKPGQFGGQLEVGGVKAMTRPPHQYARASLCFD